MSTLRSVGAGVIALAGLLVHAGGGSLVNGQQASPPPTQTPAAAQTSPSAPDTQKPVFRTGAELVRVDVVVLDRKGQPVPSLTAGDFELQEEGVDQEIRSFQFVKADGLPDADNELSLTIRSRSHAAAEASRDNVRVFIIFWDEYHIGQMASANRARASLMQFVRNAFGPTDIVAFMDPLTPIDSLLFTRDRLELFERTRRLVGRSGVYVPTRSAVEDAHLQRGDVERLRSEVTISALKAAVVHLGGLRDGRKSVILISEGLRGMMRDGQTLLTDLIRTANDNNTAIYSIDPRGFGPQRSVSLLEGVAEDTGGQFFRSNDMAQSLRQVVTESSGFYLLGYAPLERPLDGRFHKIRVKVKPPGLEVRARTGYWAPSVADMERARVLAAASHVPPEIRGVLAQLPSATARRAIDLWIGAAVDAGRTSVRLSWQPRGTTATDPHKAANLTAVAASGDTRAFDGPVGAGGIAFDAPPGPLKVTITVLDAAGEMIDRDVRMIEVPDPDREALWISSPALFRTQNAVEFRNLDRSPEAVPYAGREFLRTDRLNIRFALHGASAATAAVTAKILSQWGKELAELPLVRRSPEESRYELDLPLSTVARGEFVIAIGASSEGKSASALVPIRITR
jgi:VWFA-related protein